MGSDITGRQPRRPPCGLRVPDHPKLIQSFVWQTLDLAPRYPRVRQFLEFWKAEIEAVIHSVQLASGEEIAPARARFARSWATLN